MSVRLCCVSVIGLCFAFCLGEPFFPRQGVENFLAWLKNEFTTTD